MCLHTITYTTITTITTPPPEWTVISTKPETLSCVLVSFLLICSVGSKPTPPNPLGFYKVNKIVQFQTTINSVF